MLFKETPFLGFGPARPRHGAAANSTHAIQHGLGQRDVKTAAAL